METYDQKGIKESEEWKTKMEKIKQSDETKEKKRKRFTNGVKFLQLQAFCKKYKKKEALDNFETCECFRSIYRLFIDTL